MKRHIIEWQLYAPRSGADRKIALDTGEIVSSATEGLLVLEGPNIDWTAHSHLLGELFVASGTSGFLTYASWWPRHPNCLKVLQRAFPQTAVLHNGTFLFGTSLAVVGLVERVLAIKAELGAEASGLWSIGSLTSADNIAARIETISSNDTSPISITAGIARLLGFALCIDDGTDMVLCRTTPHTTAGVSELATKLHATPPIK